MAIQVLLYLFRRALQAVFPLPLKPVQNQYVVEKSNQNRSRQKDREQVLEPDIAGISCCNPVCTEGWRLDSPLHRQSR